MHRITVTALNARLVAALAGAGLLSALTSAQTPSPSQARTVPVFADGQAQIVPGFQDAAQWVRQTLWVETEFDSDGDGRRDRMFVDVTRPRQTETEGLKVPVIYESSPYFAGTSGDRKFLWNVNQEVGAQPPPRASQPEINFRPARANVSTSQVTIWVPRGFAVVHSDAPGTGLSQGCPTVGDAPEQLAPKAIIDWLNGRAKGFTTVDGQEEVSATSWSTGKVGMTGTSYNGTIPLAAAVTGVAGLEAVIPIAPNTSYYHYYRSNGLVRHPGGWLGEDIDFLYDFINSGNPEKREYCNRRYRDGEFAERRDRVSGDYNEFWAVRDLLTKVGNIKAAVLMAHAFNDWNVVPEHSVRIHQALKGRVPLQAYFHQGGHGGAPPLEMMNKWFTRYLYGVQNGVEKDPKAWIVREATPAPPPPPPAEGAAGAGGGGGRGRGATPPPTPYADYPNPDASSVTVRLRAGGASHGALSLVSSPKQGTEKLVDDVQFSGGVLAKAEQSPNRLLYASPELKEPVHLSGFARIAVKMASSKPAANLSVWLVVLPWTDGPISPANLITRGWADPQNHAALKDGGDFHSRARGEPLVAGRFYTLAFDLQPDDQIIPAGKRIGLMIFSSDRDFTLWPQAGTELTIDLDETTLRLPVVGGTAALKRAFGEK
ncbi:MAG TPA: Xaa-Pro dipeptidyl-peptidase [Vicinamibacterales bacterium]|nr:Xaa-Pro dipeptidyl-peptidase [Vicinamibacterales bacterium]